ncbi:hypothetical protein OSB04_004781 [Centaurea solstitialis]|uniref:Uncharacterized protein n=1 Tax=Centaurea solstitialis TaxID=347529 RepID=A0AA38TSM0_9ASTR|nr:hypothetical protein OSB04_004781 [Centaurea solstitialis]
MSSIVSVSPSFSSHSFNSLSDIADRVVQELRSENSLNDDEDDFFDFSSDDDAHANNRTKMAEENDESEFEFPVVSGELKPDSDPMKSDREVLLSSESDQIWPRYPLFDRSLLSDCSEIEPCPTPVARLSLKKLFSEERDSPSSSSSSEADDLERVTPGSYCVWKPKTDQSQTGPQIGSQTGSRGHHKKSYSIGNNISKRWKVRDLLKRSYSDDNYSTGNGNAVVVLSPTIATKKNTDHNEKAKKIEKPAKVASSGVGDVKSSSTKPENNIPVHKSKAAGGHRRPPYAPYRQDQLTLFAHFNGSSRNLYRY